MKKILSIIVPSYNMERYLGQCIDSLLIKSLDLIEILIINDGSKDKTLEIASMYAYKYPESIKVIDKSNGNYGSCINRGLSEAKGKYIKVLDADDRFYIESFEKFVKFLLEIEADLIISDYNIVDEKGIITNKVVFSESLKPLKSFVFGPEICSLRQSIFQMHGVTYRTDCLRHLGYTQSEGISYTDQEWMFMPMSAVSTVIYFPYPIYRYLVGREGQTVMAEKSRHLIPLSGIVRRMIDQLANDNLLSKILPPHKEYMEARITGLVQNIIRESILYSDDEKLHNISKDIDNYVFLKLPTVWKNISHDRIKSWIPVDYIGIWRKSKYNANGLVIKTIRKLLNIYHS